MKKFYKIFLLFVVFIFLTTYNHIKFDLISEGKYTIFEIKNIEIINNFLINEEEIKKKLGSLLNKNIFLIKRSDIEKPLKAINFLEKAEVKKKYPNTIIIKIFETKPVAILFKGKDKYFLDSSANLIPFQDDINFNQLPSIFGKEAEQDFMNFFKKLEKNNFPNKKIKNFFYFKIGRWDLQLIDNKIIKFPDSNINNAIKKSIELLDREDFKNYNIIDLRIDGKIIVE